MASQLWLRLGAMMSVLENLEVAASVERAGLVDSRVIMRVTMNDERAFELMSSASVDGVVAASKENVLYASGYRDPSQAVMPTDVYCVVTRERPARRGLVVPRGSLDAVVAAVPKTFFVESYGDFNVAFDHDAALSSEDRWYASLLEGPRHADSASALMALIMSMGLKGSRLSLERDGMTARASDVLAERVAGEKVVQLVADNDLLKEIRQMGVRLPAIRRAESSPRGRRRTA